MSRSLHFVPHPLSYLPTSTLQVDRFQSFSLVIRHVISAQLSARLGSVTLGRWRRSLDSDLDISTHRSEISGKVARPFFFEEGSSAPGAAAEVPR